MKATYQGIPKAFPAPSVTVSPGGSLLAGSYHFWIQGRNRQGYNEVSASAAKTIADGNKIDILIPGTCRPNPDGSDIQEILVLAATENDPASSYVIASYSGELPHTISLTQPEHLAIGAELLIESDAELPTSPIHGMRRQVEAWGEIRAYNALLASWVRVEPQLLNTWVFDIDSDYGCRQNISAIEEHASIYTISYGGSGGNSDSLTYWLINDASVAVPAGTGIDMAIELSGQDVSSDLNNGSLSLAFRGYADADSAVLDTTDAAGTGIMTGVDAWVYYPGIITGLQLPKALPPGTAYLLSIRINFTETSAGVAAASGSTLGFSFALRERTAERVPMGIFMGSLISPDLSSRRIVPGSSGLIAWALPGSGAIKLSASNAYVFFDKPLVEVVGLSINTANQPIYISANGNVFTSSVPGTISVLRALVSTEHGVGNAIALPGAQTLGPGLRLQLLVDYPSAIRPTYPDVVAGSNAGVFNASYLRVYLARSGENTKYWDLSITPGVSSEMFVLTGVGADLGSAAIPASNPRFGLYELTSDTVAVSAIAGSSSFTTGDYSIYVALGYEGTITEVDHRPISGCIAEATGTFADLFALLQYVGSPEVQMGGLRLIPANQRYPYKEVYAASEGSPYRWQPEDTALDDLDFLFSSSTTASTEAGVLKLNAADPTAATALYLSTTDPYGFSTSTLIESLVMVQGLRIDSGADPAVWCYYLVNGEVTLASSTYTVPISYINHQGTLGNGGQVMLSLNNQSARPFDVRPDQPGRWTMDSSTQLLPLSGNFVSGAAGENGDWGLGRDEDADTYGELFYKAAGVWAWVASILPYTRTTTSFTMPAIGENVTVGVRNARPFPTGGHVLLEDNGVLVGEFSIFAKPTKTSLTLTNLGAVAGAAPSAAIAARTFVYPTGARGAAPPADTFTGNPSEYVPTAPGQIVMRTDTSPYLLYYTTGTNAGDLVPVGGSGSGDAASVDDIALDPNDEMYMLPGGTFMAI